jgi:CheY-like chemotaxis protein
LTSEAPTAPPAPGARVLVVDDVAANREIAAVVLRAANHEVDVAGSADEALGALRERRYDVVLMDLQMPGCDGLEATRAIRALGGEAAATPVIALSAHVSPDIVRHAFAQRDDHVGKPFVFVALRERVAFWSVRRAGSDA